VEPVARQQRFRRHVLGAQHRRCFEAARLRKTRSRRADDPGDHEKCDASLESPVSDRAASHLPSFVSGVY
jgi:hypothetical protein